MWEEILKAALESGLWAVLFCMLLLYQLRDSRVRESKYRDTIDSLTDRLGELNEVKRDTSETVSILRSSTVECSPKAAKEAKSV